MKRGRMGKSVGAAMGSGETPDILTRGHNAFNSNNDDEINRIFQMYTDGSIGSSKYNSIRRMKGILVIFSERW